MTDDHDDLPDELIDLLAEAIAEYSVDLDRMNKRWAEEPGALLADLVEAGLYPSSSWRRTSSSPTGSPMRASSYRATTVLAILISLACVHPANGASHRPTPEQGMGLITAGFIVQGVGVGLSIATIIETGVGGDGEIMFATLPHAAASIPFAPLTAVGFAVYHDTPDRLGWRRGYARGLLEGAAYAGVIIGLRGLKQLARHGWCARNRAASGGHSDACHEDMILFMIWDLPVMASHGMVALGMLAAGLITLAVAEDEEAGDVALGLSPTPGGLAVHGRF